MDISVYMQVIFGNNVIFQNQKFRRCSLMKYLKNGNTKSQGMLIFSSIHEKLWPGRAYDPLEGHEQCQNILAFK